MEQLENVNQVRKSNNPSVISRKMFKEGKHSVLCTLVSRTLGALGPGTN